MLPIDVFDPPQLKAAFKDADKNERAHLLDQSLDLMQDGLRGINSIVSLVEVDGEAFVAGLNRALEKTPQNLTAGRALIWYLIRRNEYADADRIFRQLTKRWGVYNELFREYLRCVFVRGLPSSADLFLENNAHFNEESSFYSYLLQSLAASKYSLAARLSRFEDLCRAELSAITTSEKGEQDCKTLNHNTLRRILVSIQEAHSIALIGNSRSLLGRGFGSKIDEHDVVIRCNFPTILNFESDVGARTDLMVFNETLRSRHDIKKVSVEFPLGSLGLHPEPHFNLESSTLAIDEKSCTLSASTRKFISDICYSRSTTGLMAINLFAIVLGKKINIYGFDFFSKNQSHYYDQQVGAYLGHELQYERWYVEDFLSSLKNPMIEIIK